MGERIPHRRGGLVRTEVQEMKILALDLGSTTGWAVVEDGEVLNWGEETFSGVRTERLWRFQDWLHRIIHEFSHVDVLIFERPFCRGLHATRSLWGMAGVAEAEAHGQGLPSIDIVPATLKKWATGNGRASKEDMIAAAYATVTVDRHMDDVSLRDNEADAILLGMYAAAKIITGEIQ